MSSTFLFQNAEDGVHLRERRCAKQPSPDPDTGETLSGVKSLHHEDQQVCRHSKFALLLLPKKLKKPTSSNQFLDEKSIK
jgi:hypothetical protein